ncbi:hypothetical protein SK128_021933 [Halocaridina rubra]|uniref:Uncharacterized protein n=1 Tax=Halocaridina rubra TaxID=373956 RepID=A0AAN8WJL9_HALRR
MKMDCSVLLAITLCLMISGSAKGYMMGEETLRHHLFHSGYDKNTRPEDYTTVKFRMRIKHFEMHEDSSTMIVDSWMVNKWVDPRLSWLPEDYSGINKLTVPNTLLWKPDLDIFNSANFEKSLVFGNTLLTISADGSVLFVPPVKLHFTCPMDLTYWPHDTHNCTCIIGSWVHDGFDIDLQLMDDKPSVDLPQLLTGDGLNLTRVPWDLVDASIARDVKKYNCCEAPYVTIHMSLMVTRNAPAYAWIIKGPALGLSVLTLVIFMLPPAAGEKVIFGVLCLLLDMIFIAYTSFIITMAPSHVPLIVKVICKQVFLVVASIVVAAISLRFARDPHSTGLPPCIKKPLLVFSSCLCLHNYKNLVSRAHHQSYTRTLKSDEFELRENGNGHVYTGEVSTSPGLDWLLLSAVLDRICLVAFIVFFIIDIYSFFSVI